MTGSNDIIQWQTETETASNGGCWHLTERRDSNGGAEMRLANHDLICAPIGHGKDKAACFASFIESCDRYAATLAKAKKAAETQLATLTATGRDTGNYGQSR